MKFISTIIATGAFLTASISHANSVAKDIQLACSGSLTVIDVGQSSNVYESIPSRRDPPPLKKVSHASGFAMVTESTSDCETLSSKYGLSYNPGDKIEVILKADGWLDLNSVYKGTSQTFNWTHHIFLQTKSGELPLFPRFASESLNLSLSKGLSLKGERFQQVDVQKIYGSVSSKTVAEKVKAIELFRAMIEASPEWSEAEFAEPWIQVAVHVLKPNSYFDDGMLSTDPALISALETYSKLIQDLIAKIPQKDIINGHPGGSLIISYGNLISFALGKWINAPISDKVSAINSMPLLLHPDIVATYLVHVVESFSLKQWDEILSVAKTRIVQGGELAEVQINVLTSLEKTKWIGIPPSVYSKIKEILSFVD